MSASVQALMRDYAASRWPSLNHKARVARLAGLLGFGQRRTKALYHNELGTAIRAEEMTAVAALQKGNTDAYARREENYRTLEARIAVLEGLLTGRREELAGGSVARSSDDPYGPGEGAARRSARD